MATLTPSITLSGKILKPSPLLPGAKRGGSSMKHVPAPNTQTLTMKATPVVPQITGKVLPNSPLVPPAKGPSMPTLPGDCGGWIKALDRAVNPARVLDKGCLQSVTGKTTRERTYNENGVYYIGFKTTAQAKAYCDCVKKKNQGSEHAKGCGVVEGATNSAQLEPAKGGNKKKPRPSTGCYERIAECADEPSFTQMCCPKPGGGQWCVPNCGDRLPEAPDKPEPRI